MLKHASDKSQVARIATRVSCQSCGSHSQSEEDEFGCRNLLQAQDLSTLHESRVCYKTDGLNELVPRVNSGAWH